MTVPQSQSDPILMYDGLCALCNGAVRTVIRLEHAQVIRFTPLNGLYASSLLSRHPELAGEDTIVFITHDAGGNEIIRVRSDAAIAVTRYLRGGAFAAGLMSLVPRMLRDRAYRLVARHRTKILGRYDACPIPKPAVRARFLP